MIPISDRARDRRDPMTTHVDRMKANLEVFDFSLSKEDLESLRPLDTPADFWWSHRNPELVKFLLRYEEEFNPERKR